jgi:hypothetical protein
VAVGIASGITEKTRDAQRDVFGNRMLEAFSFIMNLVDGDSQRTVEERLDETVSPDHGDREFASAACQPQGIGRVVRDLEKPILLEEPFCFAFTGSGSASWKIALT